jgi:uroporphyrinogen-III synthase
MAQEIGKETGIQGKVFISTREKGGSVELARLIHEKGGTMCELPMIQTQLITPSTSDKEKISNFLNYSWIIFTSANGVKYFFEYLNIHSSALNINAEWPKYAVIGDKTYKKITSYGISVHYKAKGKDSKQFASELKGLINGTGHKVLLPTSNLAGDALEKGLGDIVQVHRVEIYRTTVPENADPSLLKKIINNDYAVIFLFSPSALNHLCSFLAGKMELGKLKVACIGPTTKEHCIQKGISPLFTAEKPNVGELFKATLGYSGHF